MKIALFNKQSTVTSSPIYIAFMILKYYQRNKAEEISIYKLMHVIKDTNSLTDPKQFMHALFFLHIVGLVSINGSNVKVRRRDALTQAALL